jgi:hypothetical protein
MTWPGLRARVICVNSFACRKQMFYFCLKSNNEMQMKQKQPQKDQRVRVICFV